MKGTLKARRQFEQVYERGRKAVGSHLVAFVLLDAPAPGGGPATLVGIVASRKVGNAVERNRAKRVLRAAFARHRTALPPGTLIVLVARRALIEDAARSDQVAGELERLLERLQVVGGSA